MTINIVDRLTEENFEAMGKSADGEIILDLGDIQFLGSRDITRLMILRRDGKSIILKNANSHIIETLNVLKINDMFRII